MLFQDFLYNWASHGLAYSLCHSCNPDSVAAYWSLLFALSKIVELGDTLFIVLRKKPLIFLHYYHHAAVLVYTVHSGVFIVFKQLSGNICKICIRFVTTGTIVIRLPLHVNF